MLRVGGGDEEVEPFSQELGAGLVGGALGAEEGRKGVGVRDRAPDDKGSRGGRGRRERGGRNIADRGRRRGGAGRDHRGGLLASLLRCLRCRLLAHVLGVEGSKGVAVGGARHCGRQVVRREARGGVIAGEDDAAAGGRPLGGSRARGVEGGAGLVVGSRLAARGAAARRSRDARRWFDGDDHEIGVHGVSECVPKESSGRCRGELHQTTGVLDEVIAGSVRGDEMGGDGDEAVIQAVLLGRLGAKAGSSDLAANLKVEAGPRRHAMEDLADGGGGERGSRGRAHAVCGRADVRRLVPRRCVAQKVAHAAAHAHELEAERCGEAHGRLGERRRGWETASLRGWRLWRGGALAGALIGMRGVRRQRRCCAECRGMVARGESTRSRWRAINAGCMRDGRRNEDVAVARAAAFDGRGRAREGLLDGGVQHVVDVLETRRAEYIGLRNDAGRRGRPVARRRGSEVGLGGGGVARRGRRVGPSRPGVGVAFVEHAGLQVCVVHLDVLCRRRAVGWMFGHRTRGGDGDRASGGLGGCGCWWLVRRLARWTLGREGVDGRRHWCRRRFLWCE